MSEQAARSNVFAIALMAAAMAVLSPLSAAAQAARLFNLPSQPLARAIPAFARQAGIQVLAPSDALDGIVAPALRGSLEPRAALRRLIAGAGLEIASDTDGVILLRAVYQPTPQRLIDGEPALVDEVVVTALRRESAASRTPVSMVVVQGSVLDDRGAGSLTDLQPLAPGLNLTEINPGQRRLSLRGAQSAGENTVALYLGETPVTGPNSATSDPSSITPDIDFFDSSRIELLKGPQGTLFGSGAMSGAVRVLYRPPDLSAFAGRADVSGTAFEGGGAGGAIHAVVNVPLVRDRLGVRLVAYDVQRPGYVDNAVLERHDVNSSEAHGFRLTGLYRPGDATTLLLTVLWQDQGIRDSSVFDGASGPYRSQALAQLPFPNRFVLVNGVLQHDFGFARLVASGSWYDWTATKYIDTSQAAIVAAFLGTYCARFVATSGTCDAGQLQTYRDYVAGILPVVGYQPMGVQSRIQEVRLESRPGQVLDWTFGAFIENRNDFSSSATVEADPATGAVERPLRFVFQRQSGVSIEQKAVFGEVGYAITPVFRIRLGARGYQYDKQSRSQVLMTSYINASVAGPETVYDNDASGWVGRAAASYQIDPRIMLYGQYSEGYRPGGVNNTPGLDADLAAYRSDQVRNFEIGLKSTARNGRLLVDVAVYELRWDDMQIQARVPNFNFIANAGAATIRGIEVEAQLALSQGWAGRWSVNLIDGRLTAPAPTGRFDVSGRVGDRIPYEPAVRLSAGLEKVTAIRGDLRLVTGFEATYNGQSGSTFDQTDIYYETMGGYGLLNLTAALETPHWRLSAAMYNALGSSADVWVASRAEYERSTIAVSPRRLELRLSRSW